MSDIAVNVRNVTKNYQLYEKNSDLFKEIFGKHRHKKFNALNDISFTVKKGEAYGILGANGSGKSTILKIISGTCYQNNGVVDVNGTVSLLNVGGGIVQGFTGMENIYYKCKIMGMTKKEIKENLSSIIEFSELGEFISQPVKKYSSGMISKLGFAIAIHIEPDILIVDEALAVGDSRFQEKCRLKMEELRAKGVTILFVSHSSVAVSDFCEQALFIDRGEVVMEGSVDVVGPFYESFMQGQITEEELAKQKIIYHSKYE